MNYRCRKHLTLTLTLTHELPVQEATTLPDLDLDLDLELPVQEATTGMHSTKRAHGGSTYGNFGQYDEPSHSIVQDQDQDQDQDREGFEGDRLSEAVSIEMGCQTQGMSGSQYRKLLNGAMERAHGLLRGKTLFEGAERLPRSSSSVYNRM